jgi:hypothetical protein
MHTIRRNSTVKTIKRLVLVFTAVGAVATLLAACQPVSRSTPQGPGSVTAIDPPTTRETFEFGELELDPPTSAPTSSAAAVAEQVKQNAVIARLLADGYAATLQFAAFTDTTQGISETDADGNPVMGGPSKLTYESDPLWTVRIEGISATDAAFLAQGPPGAKPLTASEDLLFAFSQDGSTMVTGAVYPEQP